MSKRKKLNRAQRRAKVKKDEAIYQKQQTRLAKEKANEEAKATEPKEKNKTVITSEPNKPVRAEKTKPEKKPGLFKRIGQFFSGIKQELKKVNWLSSGELMKSTGVVFGFVLFFTLLTWLEDTGFGALVAKLISA